MAKLKLLAEAFRQARFDDNGRRLGNRRYRRGDIVEVDSSQVERLLNMGRRNHPVFEEVKATEENKTSTQSASAPARPAPTGDKKS